MEIERVGGVTPVIVRLTGAVLALLLVLSLIALLSGRGEDPYAALAAYARYRPGRAVPSHRGCQPLYDYPSAYGQMCVLPAVPYCQRGYLVAEGGVIGYLRLVGCDFPAAYLLAQHGRPQRIALYRRVVMLVWDDLSAHGRRSGWFTPMQPVSSVGWW